MEMIKETIRSTLLSELEAIRDKYMNYDCDYEDNATSKALNKIVDAINALSSDQKAT